MIEAKDDGFEKFIQDGFASRNADVLDILKADLAVREDNIYSASKFGGNACYLWFLMTNKILIKKSEGEHSFSIDPNGIVSLFLNEEKHNLITGLRCALNYFSTSHTSEFIEDMTFQRLMDVDFLSQFSNHIDVIRLLHAINLGKQLRKTLDEKKVIHDEIAKSFEKERNVIFHNFCKDMNITVSSNKFAEWRTEMEYHPICGPKLKDIEQRHSKMNDALVGGNDFDILARIQANPRFINLLVMRSIIGLENIVTFALDEKIDPNRLMLKEVNRSKN